MHPSKPLPSTPQGEARLQPPRVAPAAPLETPLDGSTNRPILVDDVKQTAPAAIPPVAILEPSPTTTRPVDAVVALGQATGDDVSPTPSTDATAVTAAEVLAAELATARGEEVTVYQLEDQLVSGLDNEELFVLQRRFNKTITHIFSPPTHLPPGQPDLRASSLPDIPWDSDKLKNHAERVYASVGVGAIVFAREMRRLMLWTPEERQRTGTWCAIYFIAALFSLVTPAILALLITLVLFPSSRPVLFPPIRDLQHVNTSAPIPKDPTGVQTLVSRIEHPFLRLSTTEQLKEITKVSQRVGKRMVKGVSKHDGGNAVVERKEVESDSESEWESEGEVVDPRDRKARKGVAKKRRDVLIAEAGMAMQNVLCIVADAGEILKNALTSRPLCPRTAARNNLVAVLFPLFLLTIVLPAHLWAQGTSFIVGIAFFAQPLINRAWRQFVKLVPNWKEVVDPRDSLFSRVPNDPQVVLHILRVKEAEYNPLPPPPAAPSSSGDENATSETADDLYLQDLDGSEDESIVTLGSEGRDEHESKRKNVLKKGGKKILGGMQKAAKKVATLGADARIEEEGELSRQKVGSKIDRLLYQSRAKDDGTPDSFPAKFHGTSGHLLIQHAPSHPSILSFTPLRSSSPTFSAPLADLVEVKKRGVWIGRAILGWAAKTRVEGMGLEMRFKKAEERVVDQAVKGERYEGEGFTFEHVARRDQLFARLASVGGQQWESL